MLGLHLCFSVKTSWELLSSCSFLARFSPVFLLFSLHTKRNWGHWKVSLKLTAERCILGTRTLPLPVGRKLTQLVGTALSKENIGIGLCFSETHQGPRTAAKGHFLDQTWQGSARGLRGLHGTAPCPLPPRCREWKSIDHSLPSCERRQHGILELTLGRNLRDFLVHYLHFILRGTEVKEA